MPHDLAEGTTSFDTSVVIMKRPMIGRRWCPDPNVI